MRDQNTAVVKRTFRDKFSAFFSGWGKAWRKFRCAVKGCEFGDYVATSNDRGVRQCLDCFKLEPISAEEAYLQAALKRRDLG